MLRKNECDLSFQVLGNFETLQVQPHYDYKISCASNFCRVGQRSYDLNCTRSAKMAP